MRKLLLLFVFMPFMVHSQSDIENVKRNLTKAYKIHKNGSRLVLYSFIIPQGLNAGNYFFHQNKIGKLNDEIAPLEKTKNINIDIAKYKFSRGQISSSQMNTEINQANNVYNSKTKSIQDDIDNHKKKQKNVFIASSILTGVGSFIGVCIMSHSWKYIGLAGELMVGVNQVSYIYTF